jgi:hypothetical protein
LANRRGPAEGIMNIKYNLLGTQPNKIFTAEANVTAFKGSEHMTSLIVSGNKVNEQLK